MIPVEQEQSMGMNKTQVAAVVGVDIRPPADLVPSERPSQSKKALATGEIGKEIIRRAAYGKVTVEAIEKYLDSLRRCGIYHRAALSANLSYSSIRNLRERDPEFAAEEEACKQLWIAEKIDDPIYKFGIEGVHKVLMNQKTGQTVLGERVVQPQLALAFARKFDPAYREKVEVDNRHSGGVVVVTAPAMSKDDWASRTAQRNAARREVIDVDPKTGEVLPGADSRGTVPPQTPGGS
jgi:hypothetical protein